MSNVIYWTNKLHFETELSGTHKIHKTQLTTLGLCSAYPKQKNISNTMTLLKHINKASLLLPYEQLYIQTYETCL